MGFETPGAAAAPKIRRSRQSRDQAQHELSRIFQDQGAEKLIDSAQNPLAEPRNELTDLSLRNWLGGRDSNPDNVVQSHVSYSQHVEEVRRAVRAQSTVVPL